MIITKATENFPYTLLKRNYNLSWENMQIYT